MVYKELVKQRHSPRHSGLDTWNMGLEEEPSWHFMPKNPHPLLDGKILFTRHVLGHGRHMVGTRLKHLRRDPEESRGLTCHLCGGTCSDEHLFLTCRATKSFWRHVQTKWKKASKNTPLDLLIKYMGFDKATLLFGPNVDKHNKVGRARRTMEGKERRVLTLHVIFDLFSSSGTPSWPSNAGPTGTT